MKAPSIYAYVLAVLLISCNNISNKPVFEKLNTKELANAIKIDSSFTSFYESAMYFYWY